MTSYPYISTTGKLKDFLAGIPERSMPDKVTQDYLARAGFTSSNDRRIITVLKDIGFLSGSGQPTGAYQQYRNTDLQKRIMAERIQESYSRLFGVHPDACRKDNEALSNFFRTETGLGDQAITAMVQTFKALCDLADFNQLQDRDTSSRGIQQATTSKIGQEPTSQPTPAELGLTINLNIQLILPTTEDTKIYDAIFKSMKQNLLRGKDSSD